MKLRLVALALVLALTAAVWAVLAAGSRTREDRGAVLHALRAASGPRLPAAPRERPAARSEPARYDRDSLYELVDGAAEGYLARGFQSALAANYSFPAPGGAVEVAAVVHRFADPAGARAQLEAERPRGAVPVAGLPGAVGDRSVLLALAGRDLLELTLLSTDPAGAEALVALAAAWLQENAP